MRAESIRHTMPVNRRAQCLPLFEQTPGKAMLCANIFGLDGWGGPTATPARSPVLPGIRQSIQLNFGRDRT